MGKEKAFQTMSSMTSAQLISVAAKGLTLNPPCIPPYTVRDHDYHFICTLAITCFIILTNTHTHTHKCSSCDLYD